MNKQLEMFPECKQKEMIRVSVFELFPPTAQCAVCGKTIILTYLGGYCLPMYEDKVVNPDIQRDWGGFPVCENCYSENEYKTRLDVFGIPRDKFLSEVWG